MKDISKQIRLAELIQKELDNSLNDQEFFLLQSILKEDFEAIDYYVKTIMTISDIPEIFMMSLLDPNEEQYLKSPSESSIWLALSEDEKTAPPIRIQEKKDEPARTQKAVLPKKKIELNLSSIVIGLLSAAALFLMIFTIHFMPFIKVTTPKPVASITGDFHAQWQDSQELPPQGARLWNDGYTYLLDKGVVEITFDNGAIVLIEAPSQFEVIGESEMSFQGTLTAQVPPSAYGFTINTSNSKVVDLGTQFGLRTRDNGTATEVYVLQGKIEISSTGSSNRSSKKMVHSGQGYRIESSGSIAEVPLEENTFRWELPILYDPREPSPYERAVYATKPTHYWRFDRDRRDRLYNELNRESFQDAYQGNVQLHVPGSPLGDGRPNHAIQLLGMTKEREEIGHVSIFNRHKTFRSTGEFSVSMWVRPEAYGKQSIFLYTNHEGPMIRTSDQIYLTDETKFAFYVAGFSSGFVDSDGEKNPAIFGTHPVELNTWYHVVGTYSNDTMSLYVNGQFQASRDIEENPEKHNVIMLGTKSLEWWTHGEKNKVPFKGAVDEISQYNRELSADEVRMLYDAATQMKSLPGR